MAVICDRRHCARLWHETTGASNLIIWYMLIRTPQKNLKVTCPQCGQKLDASGIESFTLTICPACGHEVLVPRRFGQYLLEEPLAESAVGGVYRALDLKLQRDVAVKVLVSNVARDQHKNDLFLRAARKSARLNHPNVIPIYSCGQFEGKPYITMELLGNGSLADNIAATESGLKGRAAVDIIIQVARGLHAANQHKVRHGHVTPHNILLGIDNDAKIGDFGVALALRSGESSFEDLRYASPEILCSDDWDCRSDIYSLGAVLWHALTGMAPFTDDYSWRMKNLYLPPEKVNPQAWLRLPEQMQSFFNTVLSPEPENRPNSYNAVLRELTALRNSFEQRKHATPTEVQPRKSRARAVRSGPRLARLQDEMHALQKKRHNPLIDAVIGAILLAGVLLMAHGAHSKAPWYMDNVRPVVRWIAVHIGVLDPEEYKRGLPND